MPSTSEQYLCFRYLAVKDSFFLKANRSAELKKKKKRSALLIHLKFTKREFV